MLPEALGELKSLELLDLTTNRLTGSALQALGSAFTQLGRTGSLRVLYLSDNFLDALPPEIGALTQLEIACLL